MEKAGMKNIYTCKAGHFIWTVNADDGVTPFAIPCKEPGCNNAMTSGFYPEVAKLIIEPHYEWYKPELKGLSAGDLEHVKNGGLLLRKI
jgi:hypothetical protein